MAHHHVPEAGQAVDIAISVYIVQINPFPAYEDQGCLMIARMIERMNEMLLVLSHQLSRIERRHKRYLLSDMWEP